MTKYDSKGAFEKLHEDPFLPSAPPAPKKRMSGWAIAGLIILGLVIIGQFSKTDETTSSYTPSTTSTELVSYEGTTVSEMVAMMENDPTTAAICDLIPTAGYALSRQSYLDADPQLGSDAYEGAVFDALFAGC